MTSHEHRMPAEAALSGFPPDATLLFEDRSGGAAVVLVETGSSEHSYPYEVVCECVGGAWVDVASSNGPGWKPVGGRGVVTMWGTTGGSPVRVEFGGRTIDAEISGEHFFFVQWDVAEPSGSDWPRVAGDG